MKMKTLFALAGVLLALSTLGSNPIVPKNYYQFGLGIWIFEPLNTQVFTMSYERAITNKLAIGGVFTYQIEEYAISNDAPADVPLHDYVFGEAFSHPHLLTDNITTPGLVYFTGSGYRDEETFGGLYVSYTLFRKPKTFADIALGFGRMIYSFQYLSAERLDGIKIDHDTIYGYSRIPGYDREIAWAGFFRARYSYQFYENAYLGGSLVLPYVFAFGFPLKFTLNVGVRF